MEESKDVKPVRYAYGLTTALLLGGATLSLATGYPAGAQVAQNEASQMSKVVPRTGAPGSFADLTEQLAPAVVNISTRQRIQVRSNNPFAGTPFEGLFGNPRGGGPQTREAQSLGSGFIISADGYVVTNNHVITAEGKGEVESITITMANGDEYPAKLIGKDAASDLAVLKINAGKDMPFVKFGDSRDARVGDWIIAIGNPFGLGGTVTSGIISAVYRNTGAGGAYDRYLQTDAAINRGNSGGPLFNVDGEVIGVNTSILSPTGGSIGIGFSMASNVVSNVVDQLREYGETRRGWLGVRIQDVTDELAQAMDLPEARGAMVTDVPDGPAAEAGMKQGDVILSFDGKDVDDTRGLVRQVGNTAVGKAVRVTVFRDGKNETLRVTLGRREQAEAAIPAAQPKAEGEEPSEKEVMGMTLGALTPEVAEQLQLDANATGLVVMDVDEMSDAYEKGMRAGDVIAEAGREKVETLADLETRLDESREAGRKLIMLLVRRDGDPRFVALPISED